MTDERAPNSDLVHSELEDDNEDGAEQINLDLPKGDPLTIAQTIIQRIKQRTPSDKKLIELYLQQLSKLYKKHPEIIASEPELKKKIDGLLKLLKAALKAWGAVEQSELTPEEREALHTKYQTVIDHILWLENEFERMNKETKKD